MRVSASLMNTCRAAFRCLAPVVLRIFCLTELVSVPPPTSFQTPLLMVLVFTQVRLKEPSDQKQPALIVIANSKGEASLRILMGPCVS